MNGTGWTNFGRQTTKWHFIGEDGHSLCRKWVAMKPKLEQGDDDSPDNCAECKRRLARRKEKADA